MALKMNLLIKKIPATQRVLMGINQCNFPPGIRLSGEIEKNKCEWNTVQRLDYSAVQNKNGHLSAERLASLDIAAQGISDLKL